MARASHPDAMKPSKPGPTRTAPPQMPSGYPMHGPYLTYILFGATSFFFLSMALLVLRVVIALGNGPEAWQAVLTDFENPLYIAFHGVAFLVFVWAGWRFLIKLSAKVNPPKMGPLRRPPLAVFPPLMGILWLGASALVLIVLWGIFP